MELEAILTLLKDYDLPTILIGIIIYLHVNKKLSIVDKAVNQRPADAMTLSQEVSEIHRKVDVAAVETGHIMKELDAHRAVDEVAFLEIGKDIKSLHKRVTNLSKSK